ncbi:MAG: Ig-like domain-containing protein, partial [Bacteroidales bacterium]|nr:Ig-like domain-containing protein [Bacteroidales bacterium]
MTELESGGYYIFYGINDTNEGAMDNTGTSRMGATSVDINVDGKIVDPLAKIVWRVDGNSTHGYTLYSEDSGEYCEITANSTSGFSQSTTSTHEYEVSVSAGDWLFMSNHANAGGRCISIYQTDFRPYTASATKPLHLYKMPVGLDTNPPVPTFAPADAATDVPINVNPTITFDEPIYTSPGGVLVDNTNVADLITLTNGTDPVAFTATIAENVITVTPAADLAYETAHTLTVAAVQDEAGNAMAADASATFTTETADTEPPIPTFAPADAATGVPINVNPTITFDEPIYTSPAGILVDNTNVESLIAFTDGVAPVAFTATIAENVITVTPAADLAYETAHTLTVAAVQDEAGNAMTADASASFTTIPETTSGGGLEDFSNSSATASYTDGNFVGNDGIIWTYVASRDGNGDANSSGINLPALMLRSASDNSSITSSTISGGIGNFSVKLYKGFTGGGNREVELFVNGISQGKSTPFDDFNEHLFEVDGINIEGNIVISIKNTTSKQVIIDNITWTGYSAGPDTQAPVPTFAPADAATDVPINVNPTITFDEPIYTSPAGVVVDNTNVADLITLTDGTNPVAFTATIAENVITVTPAADLAYETAHTLTVAAVQDETGNVATSESITFTTMALTAQTIELTGTYDGPYYAGEAITVTWNAANFNNVKVEVWNPTTSAWGVMVTSTPAVDGTATFTIPAGAEYSADYKLRIADAEDGNPFDESGTFKVREVHSSLSTLRVRPPDTEARFDGSAVVTYSRTTRNQKYIQDNDAAILIDDNTSVITQEYPVGSEITGLIGKISIYNAVVQFIPLENPGVPASTGNAVVPFVTTLADLTSADQSKLVRLENITFISTGTFASGQDYIIHDNIETPGVFRTNFSESDYISQSIPNQNITEMLALVSEFNGILQVTSRSTHDWTILSSDATLAALTLGGESVLGHAGLEVTNPAVDEGATLFVVDFTDFKGIVANAADANASVEVRLNGTVVETVNLATQALADGDVVVVTVTAEDNTTIAHYKVTLTGENRELTLTAPVGVNNYTTGDDIVLTWTSANIDNVNLYAVDAQANLINENPIVASLGTYTYTVANGDFGTFHFRIADALDNTFYDETSQASTISDTQAPDAIATYPLLGEVDMPISFTLRIDFDEIVQLGMGNLTIHKNVDNTIVQTLTETDGTVDGNVFTVDITGLDWGTDYYINIAAGLIKDLSGNQFPAITDQSWTFTTKQPVIDLFFSEYIEGSSNNKALEIYNPTGAPVDLSAYQVKQFTNGSNVVNSTESLTGILAAGGVYVIANTSAVSEITDMADITSGVTFYNGNDAVGLYKNDVLIDIIGTKLLPVSGGSGFPDFNVAGVTGATKDHTLVRKNSVLFGNTDWAKSAGTSPEDSEWIVHEVDNFSFLGWHIEPPTHTVTFSVVNGTGGLLTAKVDDIEIYSPADVEAGKNIAFTATPEAGYQVKAWTLNGAIVDGNTSTTYTLDNLAAAANVTVEFEAIPATTFAVTYSVVGTNGSIAATVDGTAITSGDEVEVGKDVLFTATPEAGYQVKAWTLNGAIVDGNTSTTYTLDNLAAATNVTVEFEAIPATTFAVTYSVVGTNGSIAATVDGTAITSGDEVEVGKDVLFTATPEAGYQVKAWTLNGAIVDGNTSTTYTLDNLAAATNVTVEFELIPPTTFAVTYSVVGTNGAIAATVDGTAIETGAMVEAGKNIVFTATPEAGYQVKAWTLNAAPVAGNTTTTYTVETLAEATDVTVEFETIPATTYAVTFSVVGTNGAIAATVDGTAIETGAMVEAGKNIAFTATPEAGYQVKAWTLNGAIVDGNTSTTYTLDNLAAAANVTV